MLDCINVRSSLGLMLEPPPFDGHSHSDLLSLIFAYQSAGTNNDGFTKEGITFPNTDLQLTLEKQVGLCLNPTKCHLL